MMIRAPPVTPPEDRLDSASAATLVPAVDFQVTAPRSGYITDADKRGGGGGLRRRGLEMHAELVEHVLGVGEHVHQMRDRRALIAADIGDAGLQQRLGDRENALAAEVLAVAELQVLDFSSERAFRHFGPPPGAAERGAPHSSATAYFCGRGLVAGMIAARRLPGTASKFACKTTMDLLRRGWLRRRGIYEIACNDGRAPGRCVATGNTRVIGAMRDKGQPRSLYEN